MNIHSPLYLFLILPLILIIGYNLWTLKKRRPAVQFSSISEMKKVPKGIRVYLRGIPFILLIVSLGFMIFALARPQKSDTKVKRNIEGIDIMLVLDISDSMLIEDMQPTNRMESAKKTIEDFIKNRGTDRIGLVVFSGESYTRVPLTLDYEVLLNSVKSVKTTRDIKMGTAIGVALANGSARLKDSTAKSRVLILLTDGENNSGTIDPLTALDIAKGYGIRIYTIGAGVDGEAQLPVTQADVFGNVHKRYQPIHSKVNDELLNQLAEDTGGKYYRATNTKALENVFKDINKLEKTKVEVNQYTKYNEEYQWYLWVAVVLFGCAQILNGTVLRSSP